MPSTNKNYQHIFTIVYAFTKFTWLCHIKSVSAEDTLDKLKLQQNTVGNLARIITDRVSAFTTKAVSDYCIKEGIQHVQIATGIPCRNVQVERIHHMATFFIVGKKKIGGRDDKGKFAFPSTHCAEVGVVGSIPTHGKWSCPGCISVIKIVLVWCHLMDLCLLRKKINCSCYCEMEQVR